VLAPHLRVCSTLPRRAIPLFKDKGFDTGTVFNAAVVLAIDPADRHAGR
jgi:hypothetical protein